MKRLVLLAEGAITVSDPALSHLRWQRRQPPACGKQPNWRTCPGLRRSAASLPPNPKSSLLTQPG